MLIKELKDCPEFIAGDETHLREILHPERDNLQIGYSIGHAVVKVNEKSLPHRLKTSEVYYILSGNAIMYINDEAKDVCTGDAVYIPPDAVQCIKNTGERDLVFLCIVYPAWCIKDEEILK